MKLIIQIPAYNEIESLAETIADLPTNIAGIDKIEYLVIDDGSTDGTAKLAEKLGVQHIIRHKINRGLARGFQSGINRALREGADIIVNTDADNQYCGADIEKLVQPILNGEADIVIGDRSVGQNRHFSKFKQILQVVGSFVVRKFSKTDVQDAVSGFRAISRNAARSIFIVTDFSYTTEMLIQAGQKRMAVTSVPIRTNKVDRPSRLFSSIPNFIANTGGTILRTYTMFYPLQVFVVMGVLSMIVGAIPLIRFVFLYFSDGGQGHVQSIVFGGTFVILGMITILLGILADLIARNRRLLEIMLEQSTD